MKKKFVTLLGILQSKWLGYFPGYPVIKPIDSCKVEILADSEFQKSCREVAGLTVLDTPRLANLWSFCRLSNPSGHMIEVGSYRGGGALHLSNACPKRKIIVCDSFEGFEQLDPLIDRSFGMDMFKNTSHQAVDRLFSERRRDYKILAGFFPAVCQQNNFELPPLSFAHLDVDAYKPTIESLEYLAPHMLDRSFMLMDDFCREAEGVNRAVREFTAQNRSWLALPLFPSQALLIHESWFDKKSPPLAI